MKVFLVRHALAHERDRARWPDDSKRPLTQDGKRKFRKTVCGLVSLLPGAATILTSPFVRARQTAAILSAMAGGKVVECRLLAAMLGAGTARFIFKKGGVACVEFSERVASGGATLAWMLPPKLLRKMG